MYWCALIQVNNNYKGNRKNGHSIRINDQWRICLLSKEENAHDIKIDNYHKW